MRPSEQLSVLLEARGGKVLNKFPAGTSFPLYGGFGAWGNYLALIFEEEWEFDPVNMTRSYVVWPAVDTSDKKPIEARREWVQFEPEITPGNVTFDKANFRLRRDGMMGYGIVGTFLKPTKYRVKIAPKDLTMDERRKVKDNLEKEGLFDVSDVKLSKANWVKALKMTGDELEDGIDWNSYNDFENLWKRLAWNRTSWEDISGVYAETKKGDLKFVIRRR